MPAGKRAAGKKSRWNGQGDQSRARGADGMGAAKVSASLGCGMRNSDVMRKPSKSANPLRSTRRCPKHRTNSQPIAGTACRCVLFHLTHPLKSEASDPSDADETRPLRVTSEAGCVRRAGASGCPGQVRRDRVEKFHRIQNLLEGIPVPREDVHPAHRGTIGGAANSRRLLRSSSSMPSSHLPSGPADRYRRPPRPASPPSFLV